MIRGVMKLKERLGEFWWYSVLIFLACRTGDLIQAFIGLWVVPHYVPSSELGAIVPLLQIGSFWGLPLAILLYPFTKFLNLYATRGEYGKVKSLLYYVFVAAIVIFGVTFVVARFILPHFFERIRIAEGSLGTLTIAAGLLCTLAPVYNSALQALKKFNTITVLSVLTAPIRLVVLLVTMPIRALSGYVVGTMVSPLLQVFGTAFGLRRELGRGVKRCPIGCADWEAMLRYTAPVALNTIVGTFVASYLAVLFRQRLCDDESAAYYIISRLAEIGTYAGNSLLVVLFPLAAEAHAQGRENTRLARNLVLGTLLPGCALAVFFALFGRSIFSLVDLWRPYTKFAPQLAVCTLSMAVGSCAGGFTVYEMASNRFKWIWYWIPLNVLEVGGLAFLTGYTLFESILPVWALEWLRGVNAGSLNFFLYWILCFNVVLVLTGWVYHRCSQRHRDSDAGETQ